MSENIPDPAYDEPMGDLADQASRLQFLEEQAAIRAALAGRVHGTDALEDRGVGIDPLEGNDPLDEDSDASDDPEHGGGTTRVEDEAQSLVASDPDPMDLGVPDPDSAVATDEGSSV